MIMTLDPEYVLKLRKCRCELLSSLDYDLMAPVLIQEKIISTAEYERLRSGAGGNIEKVGKTYLKYFQSVFLFIWLDLI